MGEEQRGGVFDNPIILYSEHKRVLSDAIKRGDERAKEAEQRGYWRGLAQTVWLVGFAVIFASIVGFNYGLSFVQDDSHNPCVPLYDVTGYEHCR
jgi:hypothetical protein